MLITTLSVPLLIPKYKQITTEKLEKYLESEWQLNRLKKESLTDGGTNIYHTDEYTVILCHTTTQNNDVYIGKDGYLFEKFPFEDEEQKTVTNNTKVIYDFAADMKEIDIPTYFILVPNSIYINADKLPDNVEVPNQKEIIEEIYTNTQNCKKKRLTPLLSQLKSLVYTQSAHKNTCQLYL